MSGLDERRLDPRSCYGEMSGGRGAEQAWIFESLDPSADEFHDSLLA